MVFHGLWLPRPFNVASWFFAGFHRFQDGFVVFHGFSLSLVVFYFLLASWLFIVMVCSMIFHGHALFRDYSR